MSSEEDPETWGYLDLPIKAEGALGSLTPYYLRPRGVESRIPRVTKDDVPIQPPTPTAKVQESSAKE